MPLPQSYGAHIFETQDLYGTRTENIDAGQAMAQLPSGSLTPTHHTARRQNGTGEARADHDLDGWAWHLDDFSGERLVVQVALTQLAITPCAPAVNRTPSDGTGRARARTYQLLRLEPSS